jgi:hypothetical protein
LVNRPVGQGLQREIVARAADDRANIENLVGGFDGYLRHFEGRNKFGGPSRYFHDRAIERRRRHETVTDLITDERFLEYVYAVLPAWGMHRMGEQPAKVGEFADMADSFRAAAPALEDLWGLRITELPVGRASSVAHQIWEVIAGLRVSTSGTRIVAGSKALHHALPDLVPPIDRQYTFRFFTGQKAVQGGDQRAFIEWFPYFLEIASRCRVPIDVAMLRGGFMATSSTKIIDNAIIGFIQSGPRPVLGLPVTQRAR